MLEQNTITTSDELATDNLLDPNVYTHLMEILSLHGYCILRNFDTSEVLFGQFINRLCGSITFDPARQEEVGGIQPVNAGTSSIGLHIENGNTPNIPELVAFYCKRSGCRGGNTTICDGASVLAAMSDDFVKAFSQPITVTRTLIEQLWKAYLVNEHPLLSDIADVTRTHLDQMLSSRTGHSGILHDDQSLTYSVDIDPIRISRLSNRAAFANALLGPSHGYQKPSYRFADNEELNNSLLSELTVITDLYTREIDWQAGDIAVIDNWRVMHGRREIHDGQNRQLFIGMGNLQ